MTLSVDATVLVTGAAGFFGSRLCAALKNSGFYVKANDIVHPSEAWRLSKDDYDEYLWMGVQDIEAEDIISYVVHCASVTDVPYTSRSPRDAVWKTLSATTELLEQWMRSQQKPFILVSSHSVYGRQEKQPITEEACPHSPNLYGALKASQEQIALSYFHQHGAPSVVIRSTTMYGPKPRAGALVPTLLRKCLRGETITIEGSGEQTRDMNYVDNTVSGVLLAMKHGQPGEIYNIGNGYSPSINAVVEMCVEATGKQPPIEHTAPRGGEEGRLDIDISKAREQLGYEPEIPLKLGIERTLHWMLENEGAA